jgi:hypothetical protein
MLKMSAMPRPEAKKFNARTFRSLASHTTSLMLGGPLRTKSFSTVCAVIAYFCDHFDIISRTALHCTADIFDMCKYENKTMFEF